MTDRRVPVVDRESGKLKWMEPDELRHALDDDKVNVGNTMVACFMEGARQALIDSTEGARRAKRRQSA